MLRTRFAAHVESSGLLSDARNVVVACSGGGDSTALLVLLLPFAKKHGITLVPAHVAHGLRGAAGDQDARFVADLARDLALPFALRPVNVPEHRAKGESLEAAARRLRYASLLSLARELGEGTLETPVATGHTLDDQAETVLLNLLRHAGRTRGGIRPRRKDGVVRPLLPFTRAELRRALEDEGIPWREDETNENEKLLRNRVRRRLLPELEGRWPGIAARLSRAADAWTRRLDSVDGRIDAALEGAGAPLGGPFARTLLERLEPEAMGRLLVRAAGERGRVPGRAQVRRAVERLTRGDSRFEEAFGGLRLAADPRTVRLRAPSATPC
ncbi:MAG TPA: tRNA lysidine(34) synthetase TilS [Thermoanaerobaculia bacterium]|nr:tRNA lysidine(34) synthetase TilS [Thermoanaerobaculia bacterium]